MILVSCTAVGGVPVGNPKARPRDCGHERQDENPGRTAHRLPEAHRGAERVVEREGRTLHDVASGRKCKTINFSYGGRAT